MYQTPGGEAHVIARVAAQYDPPKYQIFYSSVCCGFPSPAEDSIEATLSLDELAITNQPATYLVRAQGDSMILAGIFPGDVLVVDRSLEARCGQTIIAEYLGDFVCRRVFRQNSETVILRAENPNYPEITINAPEQLKCWGVVTFTLHKVLGT